MKTKTLLPMMVMLFMLFVVGSPMAQTQQTATGVLVSPHSPVVSHYAESLYDEYAAGTAGKISFSVQTEESGRMVDLAGKAFSSLVATQPYRIVTDQAGTNLSNPRFYEPEAVGYGLHDMNYTADGFAEHGLPLEDGTYRRLLVTATMSGDVRSHEAMEFCWSGLNHCAVLDPVVVFLESKVNTRLSLASEGWGPRLTHSEAAPSATNQNEVAQSEATTNATAAKGKCGLASHHNWTGETLTWSAWTATYKDIFGITLVTKHLGKQIDGISCDTSCKPQPFSTSNTSSASGTLGWNTACANRGDAGKSGSTARSIAETKCTDRWEEKASASVSAEGGGASISFDWSLGGSVDSNGGVYTDSCARF